MATLKIKVNGVWEDIPAIQGVDGKSAYQSALDGGYVGTEVEFNSDLSLVSEKMNLDGSNSLVDTLTFVGNGVLSYDADRQMLQYTNPDGTINDIGAELWFSEGKASGAIANGAPVQFAGVQGDHYLFKTAVPSEINANPSLFMGIATSDIANNAWGKVTHFGVVHGVNTGSYTAGTILWFDSVNGGLTATKPSYPNAQIQVCAVVVSSSTVGAVLVRPTIYQDAYTRSETDTLLNAKAPTASPTFTGTVSGITASMVGLGNVTNESKATMFTNPTFTGTVTLPSTTSVGNVSSTELSYLDGVTSAIQTQLNAKEASISSGTTAQYYRGDKSWQTLNASTVGLGNVTNESKATMFTSPTFTGTANGSFNASSDFGVKVTQNGNSSSTWYGRIGTQNSTADKSIFMGVFGTSGGVFAHNNALNAWAPLYLNTVDGGVGGGVAAGSLSVGTTSISSTQGEIRATNNVTAYYSDERLKDFHGQIPNALDKVLALNGYLFTENEKAKELGYSNDRMQVGVSAQEVQSVLPEAVTDAPIGQGYLTVWYEKLVPLLIEAIKEQQKQIDELKARLDIYGS